MKRVLAASFLNDAEKHVRFPMPALAASIAALLVLGACQATGPGSRNPAPGTASATPAASTTESPGPPSPAANAWSLVALGDSEVTGSGDPTGKGWVPYYADLVRTGSGRDVIVDNRAQNG